MSKYKNGGTKQRTPLAPPVKARQFPGRRPLTPSQVPRRTGPPSQSVKTRQNPSNLRPRSGPYYPPMITSFLAQIRNRLAGSPFS